MTKANRAKISDFKSLTWTQTDSCLPFVADPNDNVIQLTTTVGEFNESLNRQILSVTGLEKGQYQLSIDKKKVGAFSSDALAAGVNLATIDTPMRKQSQDVIDLVRRRAELQFTAWRTVQRESGDGKSSKSAYDAIEKLAEELHQKSRSAAIPKPHLFSLKRV